MNIDYTQKNKQLLNLTVNKINNTHNPVFYFLAEFFNNTKKIKQTQCGLKNIIFFINELLIQSSIFSCYKCSKKHSIFYLSKHLRTQNSKQKLFVFDGVTNEIILIQICAQYELFNFAKLFKTKLTFKSNKCQTQNNSIILLKSKTL